MRLLLLLLLSLPVAWPASLAAQDAAPAPMLAGTYHGGVRVDAYFVSEKLDGVRARWDGRQLWTRGGAPIVPPAGFTRGWPAEPMDGELWAGRGRFEQASATVRQVEAAPGAWAELRFMLFDLPGYPGTFAERLARMRELAAATTNPSLALVEQRRLGSTAALDRELARVVAAGGEGLMLHRADARYRPGRSEDLLKYKPYQDAEAQVVGHVAGKGRLQGVTGALLLRMPDGRRFRIGSGFTDAERADPPPPGAWVTYRYSGLTRHGLPRFPRFLRVREEPPPPDPQAPHPGR